MINQILSIIEATLIDRVYNLAIANNWKHIASRFARITPPSQDDVRAFVKELEDARNTGEDWSDGERDLLEAVKACLAPVTGPILSLDDLPPAALLPVAKTQAALYMSTLGDLTMFLEFTAASWLRDLARDEMARRNGLES